MLNSVVLDGVGSPLSPCREGTGFTTPTANGPSSFERAGVTTDTDDNAADFQSRAASDPQNRALTEPPAR